MAAPNLRAPTSVVGKKLTPLALTTSAQAVLSNAADSGLMLMVIDLQVANIDGTNAANVTLNAYPQDDIGGSGVARVSTVQVPPNSTMILASRANPILLEEDQSIGALASANGDLVMHGSYLEIA